MEKFKKFAAQQIKHLTASPLRFACNVVIAATCIVLITLLYITTVSAI